MELLDCVAVVGTRTAIIYTCMRVLMRFIDYRF